MALGNTYNNNKNHYENRKAPTVYSKYEFSNIESIIDPSKLSPTFWNRMLKLSIAPVKQGTGDKIEFDYEKAGAIYLTHIKAKLLADEIDLFLQNPETYSNLGVPSGSGLISISNGKEFTGNINPCLVIRKLTEEGQVDSAYVYEFKSNYHYSIRNYKENSSEFDKIYNNNLEMEMLKVLLIQYYEAMCGAIAYSIMDYDRFDTSRINTKLDSIAEKLGVSYSGGNSKNNYKKKGSSVFDKAQGTTYEAQDIDDIMENM